MLLTHTCGKGDTYLRSITEKERNTLHLLLDDDLESGYRAKIILLKKMKVILYQKYEKLQTIMITT
jgi:hypothetical protein